MRECDARNLEKTDILVSTTSRKATQGVGQLRQELSSQDLHDQLSNSRNEGPRGPRTAPVPGSCFLEAPNRLGPSGVEVVWGLKGQVWASFKVHCAREALIMTSETNKLHVPSSQFLLDPPLLSSFCLYFAWVRTCIMVFGGNCLLVHPFDQPSQELIWRFARMGPLSLDYSHYLLEALVT